MYITYLSFDRQSAALLIVRLMSFEKHCQDLLSRVYIVLHFLFLYFFFFFTLYRRKLPIRFTHNQTNNSLFFFNSSVTII